MIQEIYIAIAPALPIAALFISLISLIVSMRNRTDQRQALLLEKKTELVTTLADCLSKLGQLALIYIQKKDLILKSFDSNIHGPELKRINDCLTLVVEEQLNAQDRFFHVRHEPLTDLTDLEDMLATANEAFVRVTAELATEQQGLADLQK